MTSQQLCSELQKLMVVERLSSGRQWLGASPHCSRPWGKYAEPNQLQLEIVPPNSALSADLFVPSRAIGFVRVGQRVSIRYAAFPYQNFGRYAGTVVAISKNILTSADSPSAPVELKQPAYRVTATLDRQDIDAYGKRVALQAGMLLQGDIILDRRSLMKWVLDPVFSARGQLDAGL